MTVAGRLPEQPEEHNPQQPSWNCRACGNEWPCAPARADLTAESIAGRTSVLVYLTMCLADAVADLSTGRLPADMYGRFVGWASVNLVDRG
jgi:hypothetical protein